MKNLNKPLKIREELQNQEKISYASDIIALPRGGIDCSEGCNPYGFPPSLEMAMHNFDIHRFGPYPHSQAIYEGLTEYWKGYSNIERDNVLLSDGSINALYTVFNVFNSKGAVVLGISPQFTDAEMFIKISGMEYRSVPLRKERNYRFDPDEFIENIDESVSLIYIDNPNNPTGQVISLYAIEKILNRAIEVGAAVIVDEAYGDFMPNQNSSMQLTEEYPNLIMIRSLSKAFGLAGLRIGYVIAPKQLISYMRKITNPYQVSEFAREMGGEALKHSENIWKNIVDFSTMKREIRDVLKESGNLFMPESSDTVSIFLLIHKDETVDLYKEFLDKKILSVPGVDFNTLGKNSVRIRLPRIEDFDLLLNAIKAIHLGYPFAFVFRSSNFGFRPFFS